MEVQRTLYRIRDTKRSVLFESVEEDGGIRNIYLRKELVEMLGDPSIIHLVVRPVVDDDV